MHVPRAQTVGRTIGDDLRSLTGAVSGMLAQATRAPRVPGDGETLSIGKTTVHRAVELSGDVLVEQHDDL